MNSLINKILNLFKTPEPPHTPLDTYKPLRSIKYLRQIVTADSRTSRTLMWNADSRLENVKLEYRMIGEELANFASVAVDNFNGENIYISAIKNLKSSSLYQFRIINNDFASDWNRFVTAGNGDFEMLVLSDSQCLDYNVWRKTATVAAKNFPDAEIFTVIGDLVDIGQDVNQWREWYDAANTLLNGRVFAPVMGNHECYGTDWFDCLPEGYLHNFKLPSNDTRNFGGYFYSFNYGAAHFFVLNTQFMELEKFKSDLKDAQEYWLRHDAANNNRRWKIVLMHKDIYDYTLDKFSDIGEDLMWLFDELEIDLVLTGHLHTYRNRGHIYAKNKSNRGTVYVICGRSGDQKYVSNKSHIDNVTVKNLRAEMPSYIVLDVRADKLSLKSMSVDGEILDNFSLIR